MVLVLIDLSPQDLELNALDTVGVRRTELMGLVFLTGLWIGIWA